MDVDRILMALRQYTGYHDGWWEVPSGHIEGNELPKQALIRETFEEVGIILHHADLTLLHTSYRPQHDQTGPRADWFFGATRWEGHPRVCEPDKCAEVAYLPRDRLPTRTIPHIRHAIECVEKGIGYSELGEHWLKENGVWMLD
jgi:8-oxo-dGTP pyrophosphatase MutT (NUDIX family)